MVYCGVSGLGVGGITVHDGFSFRKHGALKQRPCNNGVRGSPLQDAF